MCGKSLRLVAASAVAAVVAMLLDDDAVVSVGVGGVGVTAGNTQLSLMRTLLTNGVALPDGKVHVAAAEAEVDGALGAQLAAGPFRLGFPFDFGAAGLLSVLDTPFPFSFAFLIAGPSAAKAVPDCLMRPACWLGPPHSLYFRGVVWVRPSRRQAYAALV